MIVRVFGFIWGATFLTLLLFSVLIYFVDLTPPEDVRRRTETELLITDLGLVYDRLGPSGARSHFETIASGHPQFRLEDDAACTDPAAIGKSAQGCLRLVYLESPGDRLSLAPPLLLPLFIGALVSAVMAIFLSRRLTRPLRDVSQGLKAIAGGRLDTRILERLRTSNSEIRDLGRDFDLAAERLQALTEGRNRLFHDISHEIRSPLARLRAAVGLIEVNPARGAALAGRMEGDIARLDRLVDEILTLARLDRGEPLGTVEAFDLLDIIENIISDANFEGRENEIRVRYRGDEKLELTGNPELLHRACENVVRNALSYSPRGGIVSVTGSQNCDGIVLEVADNGPGVPKSNLKTIFNPFVRVDTETAPQGIGLGLAIAASAVRSHGGEITALNRAQGGLLIRIAIPFGHLTHSIV
ncbi:HAMP domain-containing sensor histidine kinase [Salipiger thiooxidans]|uniref:HAMP domain-containing sensor histidine kinase n=1 Tax=Salipiger thiooxidans TaxID=282683 RepID=UPI001CD66D6A|nr:ATP-binding protein [Salipiger thiooxidans]MCA0846928.1 HAMP domain-containing protein [Salipiger thiooxidans]